MAMVLMVCAHCARDIDTGISVDQDTFDRLPQVESEMVCPTCGARNFWDKARARLASGPKPGPAAAVA
jgi:DNA-directed RNA polymerase subunit RPC12/RpoP